MARESGAGACYSKTDRAAAADAGTGGCHARRRPIGHLESRTRPVSWIFNGAVVPFSERARSGRADCCPAQAEDTSSSDRKGIGPEDSIVAGTHQWHILKQAGLEE